jgi:Family of unknown function (DUF6445)
MAVQSLIVLDDFYDDPDSVRRLALSAEFRTKPGATYPGREAICGGKDWTATRNALRTYIDDEVDAPSREPPFPQGKFRLALASDQQTRLDGVHEDVQLWSAVIYLSRDVDCRGGVAFYRHRETGALASSAEWHEQLFAHHRTLSKSERVEDFWRYMRDDSHWEEIGQVAMRYNRAVLLMAQCFHASTGIFGTEPQNGRLTQHFEFYEGAATDSPTPRVVDA